MSISDALSGFAYQRAATQAMAGQVDELFGEFAGYMGELGVPLAPFFDNALRGAPVWKEAWIASSSYGHEGTLEPYSGPAKTIANRFQIVVLVEPAGDWHIGYGESLRLTPLGRHIGDRWYRYPCDQEETKRTYWQPDGVPISANWRQDWAHGLLYPAVQYRVYTDHRRKGHLVQLRLSDYLARCVQSARDGIGRVAAPGHQREDFFP